MRKLYSTFPGGRLGVGLLILRTTSGVTTAFFGGILISRLGTLASSQLSYLSHLVLALMLVSASVFLVLGLWMPSVSITLAGCQLLAASIGLSVGDPLQGRRFGWLALSLLASISIAFFFLGPGAYSIDARRYGRKRIFIPSSKKDDLEE